MATKLTNLQLSEFSILHGKQPANPGATTFVYKARTQTEEGKAMKFIELIKAVLKALGKQAEDTAIEKAAGTVSAEVEVIDAVKATLKALGVTAEEAAIEKATRTVQADATSTHTYKDVVVETIDGGLGVVEQSDDAAKKAAGTGEGGDIAVVVGAAVSKAVEPVTDSLKKLGDRVDKLETQPKGSQVVKSMPHISVSSNSGDQKFPEFAKALAGAAGLTPGQKLSKAAIVTADFGAIGIIDQEATEFIDLVVDESALLSAVRRHDMSAPTVKIDKIGLNGKVFRKGVEAVDPGETANISAPTQIVLSSSEVIAVARVSDDTLEDNIEGDAFVQHLLRMVAAAGSNELEEMAMYGDTGVADPNGILDLTDGWNKKARAAGANIVDATLDADRFWPGANGVKASKLIKALPTKFRTNRQNLRFIQHPDIYLDMNDVLGGQGSGEAFAAITGIKDVPTKGIQNLQMPLMRTDEGAGTDETMIWLTDLRNLILGVQRRITIEPDRQPRLRATDWVITMRLDVQIEESSAIAIYDKAAVQA